MRRTGGAPGAGEAAAAPNEAARAFRDGEQFVGEASAQNTSIRRMSADVVAHITGTVWEIRVSVGDSVQEGQTLVVLESMKMEMPVESPSPGRVASIVVAKGQAVEEGEVLLTLD